MVAVDGTAESIVFPELGKVLRKEEAIDARLRGAVSLAGWFGEPRYHLRGIWFPTVALGVAQSADESYRHTYEASLRAWLFQRQRVLPQRVGIVPTVLFDYSTRSIGISKAAVPAVLVPIPYTAADLEALGCVMEVVGRMGGVTMIHENFISRAAAEVPTVPRALDAILRTLQLGLEEGSRLLAAEVCAEELGRWLSVRTADEREAILRADSLRVVPRGGCRDLVNDSLERVLLYGSDYPHPGFIEDPGLASRWQSHLWDDFVIEKE